MPKWSAPQLEWNSLTWDIKPYLYNRYRSHQSHQYDKKPYKCSLNADIIVHTIDTQDKMTNILYKVQQQSSKDLYITNFKNCMGGSSEEFTSWLLSIEKVSKSTGNNPKDICFAKAENNFLKFIYSLPLHQFLWYSLKEKMQNFQ